MIHPQVDEPHQMMDVSSKGCFGQEGVAEEVSVDAPAEACALGRVS